MTDFLTGLFYGFAYGFAVFAAIMLPMIAYALIKRVWRGK